MDIIVPTLTLNNKVEMPQLGFGVCLMPDGQVTRESVKAALRTGYRNIDTAAAYRNERGVGEGVREAIREYGINREDVFVSTKAWHDHRGYEPTLAAFDESMEKLGLDYLDLYLIHWPANAKWHDDWRELNQATWRALEKIYESGRVRAIGLSNFLAHHVEAIMDECTIMPMVNQIEYHPGFAQTESAAFCQKNGIAVEAWSPLGRAEVLDNATLKEIAVAHGKDPSHICLRWLLQKDIAPLPKTTHEDRMASNMQVFDFELSKEEMAAIDSIPYCGGMHFDPDTAQS